jgi:hypothetical protein
LFIGPHKLADVKMHQKEKVHFQSEGLKVVGNLFKPQNFKEGDVSLPAILVAGAMTGPREKN